MSEISHKEQCPSCAESGNDNSHDNLIVYQDGGNHCFACGYHTYSEAYKEEHGLGEYAKGECEELTKEFNRERWEQILSETSNRGNGYRSISDKAYKKFHVRTEFDQASGEVTRQYYPITTEGKLTGVKIRQHPKKMWTEGLVGKSADLFGYCEFKSSVSKYLMICSGESDTIATWDMLSGYFEKKGWETPPCVSSTTGEGAVGQFQRFYEWIDRFEKIVIVPDEDEAGHAAANKLLKILPKGKVYIMELPEKDANDMLKKGMEQDFINRFFKARQFIPEGLTSSADLTEKMLEYLNTERLALAPCMKVANAMLRGGLAVGTITNFLSASGTGKSTVCDANIVEWIMNSGRKVGIMALEASEGEYATNLASAFLGFKINLLETREERVEFVSRPDIQDKLQELWIAEDGSPRFYLIDASVVNIQSKSEYLVKSLGVSILCFDPIQDILDLMDDAEQQVFIAWQKEIAKAERINIININHARKNSQNQKANSKGADLSEEDIHGTSSIYKSGAVNIIMMRDKEADDPIVKNTTRLKITKARGVGNTGLAGQLYYDNDTHTLYDYDDWIMAQRAA